MDLATTLNKTPAKINKKLMIGCLTASLMLVSFWGMSSFGSEPKVKINALRIATIKQGNFNVNIDGYGRLRAKHQRLLTSQSQAIVESIQLYPGAIVTKDSIILTLSDPRLEQEVVNARLELARQHAEFKEQKISHKSQLLERDAQIALLKSELENAQLRVEAEQKLIDKGIVSALDFKRTQLNVRQLNKRLEIEYLRQDQLKEMQQERLKISKDLITQFELNFETINNRYNRLIVRAGLDGVLQTLPIEIGQSVMPGTQLATVGSVKQLVAELRVQQNQADQVSIGMPATISTFGASITAKVLRIDPVVTDGRVMIELDLLGVLPTNARPDLTVEGKILVKTIENTYHVEQPQDAYAFKNKEVFKLTSNEQSALLTTIEFGTLSGNTIEITSGAKVGDKIIISDMAQWQTTQKILITK